MEYETKVELVKRLLSNGGLILVAGGKFDNLDNKIREHPQILLWEDDRQDYLRKEVPANTRAILFNRFLSHSKSNKLMRAAKDLRIPFFPALSSGEVRKTVLDIMESMNGTVPAATSNAVTSKEPWNNSPRYIPPEGPAPSVVEIVEVPVLVEEGELPLRGAKKGEHTTILADELRDDENHLEAAKRLIPIYKNKYGIKITQTGLQQAIVRFRSGHKPISKKVKSIEKSEVEVKDVTQSVDELETAEKLLREARASIDLFLELIPRIRKENAKLKKQREKLKSLFLD